MSLDIQGEQAVSYLEADDKQKTCPVILLVEDEKVMRMVTKKRLEKMGYSIIEAENGKQAMEILEQHPVDCIISDWMMPEMNGLELCETVKTHDSLRSTYFILMTALDQPEQVAEGLTRGADDFLTKSASEQEIYARVNAGVRTSRLIKELAHSNDVIRAQQKALDTELQSAGEFVVSLLPTQGQPVSNIELAWEYRPSDRLGGDLFQVAPWGKEHLGLMILDMSGHGIGPALRAISLAMTFRDEQMAQRHPSYDPGEIIERLNRENPLTDNGEYFTIWVGSLHLPTLQLRYATAGHPGAIVTRDGEPYNTLGGQTLPIGFDTGQSYVSKDYTLQSGDRLLLFSDGIYEVMSSDGTLWGTEGLGKACETVQGKPMIKALNWIIQQSQFWQKSEKFGDDVALVGVEIQ